MKFINTIKKYFNNENNINLSLNTNDNSFDKISLETLDYKINELQSIINGLINFTEIKRYNIETPEWASNCNGVILIIGRLCIIYGSVYCSIESGQHYIELPLNLRPRVSQVYDWSPKNVSGTNYNVHFDIKKSDPSRISFYNYTAISSLKSIPFSLIYELDSVPDTTIIS